MYAVVRVRGSASVNREMLDTLDMLRLKAVNNCVIVPETESYKGMLQEVKDLVTYGEVSKDMLAALIKKRAKLTGNKRMDEKNIKSVTGFDSFDAFADALITGKAKLKDFAQIKLVFKLTPPSKGYESIKQSYPRGSLGYRGQAINELLKRMI
jgi:large subunit ribosomal protein L30